jgi:hypothetical protein
MQSRSLASLVGVARAALAAGATAVIAASCGGSVVVEDPVPAECEDGLTSCGGKCVALNVDIENCGGCGIGCFEGTCSNGSCVPFNNCPPNLTNCYESCVDTSSDPYNCGGCDLYCESGVCQFGSCQAGECYCGSLCDILELGSDVPQSAIISAGSVAEQWFPTCAMVSGSDAVFRFYPPQDGVYSFDTFGSSVDAVLEIVDTGCGHYGCDGGQGNGGGFVSVKLGAGQVVLAIVDSQGQPGEIQLNINLENFGCATCGEVLQSGDPGNGFCPGSEELYNQIVNCICLEDCAMPCETACNGQEFLPECEMCIYDPMVGCGNDLDKCLNDI